MSDKLCPSCRRRLSTENFGRNPHVQDGLMAQCYDCLAGAKPLIASRRSGSHENVTDVLEGRFVAQLVYVFKQLEALGVKRQCG